MIALFICENRVDVEDSRVGELSFGAEKFLAWEFDADFVFGVDIRFKVRAGELTDLADVRRSRFFCEIATADKGPVFGGGGRQRGQQRSRCRQQEAEKQSPHPRNHPTSPLSNDSLLTSRNQRGRIGAIGEKSTGREHDRPAEPIRASQRRGDRHRRRAPQRSSGEQHSARRVGRASRPSHSAFEHPNEAARVSLALIPGSRP